MVWPPHNSNPKITPAHSTAVAAYDDDDVGDDCWG